MRIGLVTCAIHPGGVETFLKGLCRFFVSQGHEVVFVETTSRGRWADQFEQEGLPAPGSSFACASRAAHCGGSPGF